MDVLTSETCWALNKEIIKQATSSWSLFTQLMNVNLYFNFKLSKRIGGFFFSPLYTRHECTVLNGRKRNVVNAQTRGKYERLVLWKQLYVSSLSKRDLRNFRPLDFCWTECTYASRNAFRVSSPKAERTVKFSASLFLQQVPLLMQIWLKSFFHTSILQLSLTRMQLTCTPWV